MCRSAYRPPYDVQTVPSRMRVQVRGRALVTSRTADMVTLNGLTNMASGQVTRTARHQDMSSAGDKDLGRRIKVSVVSLAVFATLLVLQQALLSEQISDLVPQHRLTKNTTASSAAKDQMRTCAVVGNGGILLDSHCGDDIDAKDYVIRANLPALEGFETDVGRRTNMTFVNTNVVKRLDIASKLQDRTRDPYPTRLRHFNNTVIVGNRESKLVLQAAAGTNGLTLNFWTCKHDLRKNKIINPNGMSTGISLTHIYAHIPGNPWEDPEDLSTMDGPTFCDPGARSLIASRVAGWRFHSRPSSGLTTVLITSTFCSHLSLYGFYPYRDADNKPISYHYFPDDGVDEAIVNRKKHHLPAEYRLYRELHTRGVLTLQEGKCERKENSSLST
ncbi:hypothetical protein Bbelb_296400 [Branchiostoma belcheri]|nr:hypothetical protein Bbelb_296400 [Branchiostoma belcheri]